MAEESSNPMNYAIPWIIISILGVLSIIFIRIYISHSHKLVLWWERKLLIEPRPRWIKVVTTLLPPLRKKKIISNEDESFIFIDKSIEEAEAEINERSNIAVETSSHDIKTSNILSEVENQNTVQAKILMLEKNKKQKKPELAIPMLTIELPDEFENETLVQTVRESHTARPEQTTSRDMTIENDFSTKDNEKLNELLSNRKTSLTNFLSTNDPSEYDFIKSNTTSHRSSTSMSGQILALNMAEVPKHLNKLINEGVSARGSMFINDNTKSSLRREPNVHNIIPVEQQQAKLLLESIGITQGFDSWIKSKITQEPNPSSRIDDISLIQAISTTNFHTKKKALKKPLKTIN